MEPSVNPAKRLVIVGGVAGGASAAARARRLDERAEIILLERGADVSFANCGLPYHVGGVITQRDRLLVQTPQGLRKRFNIDVRVRNEVIAIDRTARTVTVRDLAAGRDYTLPYDKLILSPGANPIRPPVPGIDLPNVLTLRNMADMDRMIVAASGEGAVAVIGAGYIGLEMVDNLQRRGLRVTLIEKSDQVFPLLDREMANPVAEHIRQHGVEVVLGDGLAGFEAVDPAKGPGPIRVRLSSGRTVEADFAVLAVGVRPDNALAKQAGLDIGPTGGIVVNEHMQTSDPDIYAVGDSVQVRDTVTGQPAVIPLAGPANRQGRVAANHIFAAKPDRYVSTQGTSIVGVFDLTVALTGATEKGLKRAGLPYRKVHLHPFSHATYYPGAIPMSMKMLFAPNDGRLLGAQIVGGAGVDKRIDVLAVAVRHRLTVFDLENLELAYAPAYGSAKDPVNMAGFLAANIMSGLSDEAHFDQLVADDLVLDVRTAGEFALGHLPNAVNIPVDELRQRLGDLPGGRRVHVYCGVGIRAYVAERILKQNGIAADNLSGGWKTWTALAAAGPPKAANSDARVQGPKTRDGGTTIKNPAQADPPADIEVLDARGLQCPGPIMQLNKKMAELGAGVKLRVLATDPGFVPDVKAWANLTGNRLIDVRPGDGQFAAIVEKASGVVDRGPAAGVSTASAASANPQTANGFTAVVFSGSMDRALAALVLANGAAANGMPATLFFTFWGLSILRKPKVARGKVRGLLDRMFAWMLPAGVGKLRLSQWHFAGAGRLLMKHRMKSKNIMNLPQLLESAQAAGVRLVACQMSMDMLGLRHEDLIDGVELGGVASFMESAVAGRVSLFI